MSRYADRRWQAIEARPATRDGERVREAAGLLRDALIGALVFFAFIVVASGTY